MANKTYEQADKAAEKLVHKLGSKSWFLGAGVSKEGDDFVVALRVKSNAPSAEIPNTVEKVSIQVVRQKMAKAQ